jgi:hypothetical protein
MKWVTSVSPLPIKASQEREQSSERKNKGLALRCRCSGAMTVYVRGRTEIPVSFLKASEPILVGSASMPPITRLRAG